MENLLGPAIIDNQALSMALTKQMFASAKPQRVQSDSPMEELGLLFKKDDTNDINQLRQILGQVLKYPSSQLAEVHMDANRLGELDLNKGDSEQTYRQFLNNLQYKKICSCCGFFMQKQSLSICTNLQSINHMGISTFLYFETIKNIIGLLTVMFFVMSIYAIISNVVASNQYKDAIVQVLNPNLISFDGFLVISLGSKQLHQSQGDKISYTIQCWLGVAVIVIWMILFGIIKQRERNQTQIVDADSKSAADYTILIKNLPENMTKEQLQKQLEQYKNHLYKENKVFTHTMKSEIKINKINKAKPFYLQQGSFEDEDLDLLNKQFGQYREKFIEWIRFRENNYQFPVSKEQRQKTMKKYQQVKEKRKAKYEQIAKKIVKQLKGKETEGTVPAFVTFESSYNKQFIQFVHEDMKSLLNYLPCVSKDNYFHFKKEGSDERVLAQVRAAYQPQDIIWTNLGQTWGQLFKKKLFTYVISFMVLGASFGAIYGLSKVQFEYSKTHKDVSNQYISILISLCISIINVILQQTLRFLTKLERSSTNTQHQTSLALKAVLALLINSIAIPILVNYFFKQNLYGVNGLAYDVFYLGITNSFLSPLLKIFDGYYLFTRILKKYKNRPSQKLQLNQNQLNTIFEYMEFQIGYEYIYIVNLYLFTCFFAPLQPIIVLFAICGLTMMFWAQKYSLFNRCQRPFPGRKLLNSTMYQLIYFGPAFYTIGSFCWSHFFKTNFIGIAPNLVAAILSGIIIVLPYKKVSKFFYQQVPQPQTQFFDDRIFMPSQYDRLNPHTAQEGIQSYKNYLSEYKQYFQQNKNNTENVERMFMKQYGMGARRKNLILPSVVTYLTPKNSGAFSEEQLIMQNLFGTNQNAINPILIGNTILGNQNQLNIPIQNWLTREQGQTVNYAQNNQNNNQNGAFAYNLTKSIFLPQNGETVTYQTKPEVNKDGDIKILYEGIMGNMSQGNRKNKLPPIGQQPQRNSIEVPLNVPINIFQALGKLTQNSPGNIPNHHKKHESRFQTNNNNNMGKKSPPPHPPTGFNGQNNGPNLLDHIVNPNNFQQKPYDPYSINLHSEDHLNPLNPHNILSPNNLNNQYGTNPYTNNQFGNQYGGYNPYPNNNPYGYGK